MNFDFDVDDKFGSQLPQADEFVRNKVEPLDLLLGHPCDLADPRRGTMIPPLQQEVRDEGLQACHLGPDLGGLGYGQVSLALLDEILGRSWCAPVVFGCRAADSGNAEIPARYGTDLHKERYLRRYSKTRSSPVSQ